MTPADPPPQAATHERAGHGLGFERPRWWQQRVPGPQVPGLVSGVTLLLGVWLVMAPFAWTYGNTGDGLDARWNDIVVGIAVVAVGVARLVRPIRLVTASGLGVILGGWLIIAPFLLDYGLGADSTRATVSDVLVGMTVAGLAVLGFVSAHDSAASQR